MYHVSVPGVSTLAEEWSEDNGIETQVFVSRKGIDKRLVEILSKCCDAGIVIGADLLTMPLLREMERLGKEVIVYDDH